MPLQAGAGVRLGVRVAELANRNPRVDQGGVQIGVAELYYVFDPEEGHIDVVAIWSTRRGRGPF